MRLYIPPDDARLEPSWFLDSSAVIPRLGPIPCAKGRFMPVCLSGFWMSSMMPEFKALAHH